MKFGLVLAVPYERMRELAIVADDVGFESLWLPEHLILPARMEGSPFGDDHPPIAPDVPTFDVLVFLASLATATSRIRLGTWVYNLALRSPFVAARAVQTLDHISGGRVEFGVGAGWLRGEFEAVGVDFASRGRRLDEAIGVLRALWREVAPEFHGSIFDFDEVRFEPKPIQGEVPIHVGGESPAALRRAVRRGDGWIGMDATVDSAREKVGALWQIAESAGRERSLEVTVGATPRSAEEVAAYAAVGVDRVIARPWERARDAVTAVVDYAREVVRPAMERAT